MGDSYQIRDQFATYFLTFTVVGWADVFSRQIYRDVIIDSLDFCRKTKSLKIYAYVIMTNHVHAIMRSEDGDLSGIIRDFKKFTSKKIIYDLKNNRKESRRNWLEIIFKYHGKYNKRNLTYQFWTHYNHAVELSDIRNFNIRFNYIHKNPVKAGWVEKAEDYLYSSARNYANLSNKLEIDFA